MGSRIISLDFAYHQPATLDEALRTLRETRGAKILAGGTDLLIQIKTGEQRPTALVQILGIEALRRIEFSGKSGDSGEGASDRADHPAELRIGAAVQLFRLEADERIRARYPALHEAVNSLGSIQVRNMATLAGNLCNASPSADTATPLMVLAAELEIAGQERDGATRLDHLPLEAFFTGPGETVLKGNQLLTAVRIPTPAPDSGSAFGKIARVSLDMAKISSSVYVERRGPRIERVRIAVGGAAPRPVRARGVEEALTGREFGATMLEQAARRVVESIAPITDIRSTAEYRSRVAAVVIRDTFLQAWQRAGGENHR